MFVEITRLLVTVLWTGAGYELAGDQPLLGATVGAGVGYVGGGLIGRTIARGIGRLEKSTTRYDAAQLLVGGLGAAVVGGFGALIGITALLLLPARWATPVFGLCLWLGAYAGFRIAARRAADLLGMFGIAPQPPALSRYGDAPGSEDSVLLDTSVLIDGRVLEIARAGFLRGNVIVPRFVLDELQGLADAQKASTRRRGRRGLDVVEALSEERGTKIHVLDEDPPGVVEVDAKLLLVARRHRLTLATLDQPLASLARIEEIPVVDVQALADVLRPEVAHGDRLVVEVVKPGKERGQGVGFLDDGTMVVITDAEQHVGMEVEVEIVSSMQTSVGRMLFAVANSVTVAGEAVPAAVEPQQADATG